MTSSPSSSDCCCRLQDQVYMELVFENGNFLAKGQRSNVSVQDQRTKSIMDLYEAEYNEDFKKSIHGGTSCGFKNHVESQVVPEHHRMMAGYENRKNIEFVPPDEQSVVAERSVEMGFGSSFTGFTEESEGSTFLSSSLDDESDDASQRVPARASKAFVKRKQRTEVSNSAERKERNDINKRMRTLQDLLPYSHKDDNELVLDGAINYMTTLQHQVQIMTMGNGFVAPSMMLPMGPYYSQMGLPIGMGMQMGAPQFLPGINDLADIFRYLNHPGLMPMQNSSLFNPMENCSPQSAPPSGEHEQPTQAFKEQSQTVENFPKK